MTRLTLENVTTFLSELRRQELGLGSDDLMHIVVLVDEFNELAIDAAQAGFAELAGECVIALARWMRGEFLKQSQCSQFLH